MPVFLLALFSFVFGSIVGSFLNVVILRTEKKQKFDGRSHCTYCQHQLSTLDLVPIFSFLYLKGKCRYCHHKLTLQYPLVEFATAFIFLVIFWQTFPWRLTNFENGLSVALILPVLQLLFYFFAAAVLIVVSVYDLKTGLIPDSVILPASAVALAGLVVLTCFKVIVKAYFLEVGRLIDLTSLTTILFSLGADLLITAGLAGFFLLLILMTKGRGMGGGDFKLSIFIGLSLGWPLALVGVFLGFLTGAFSSVMLILLGKKTFKQTVPFGPFLALGSLLAIAYGKEILELYLKSMGLK